MRLRGARLYQTIQRTVPLVLFEHGGNDIHVKGPGTIAGTNASATFSNGTEHGHGVAFGGVLDWSVTGVPPSAPCGAMACTSRAGTGRPAAFRWADRGGHQ